MTTKTYAIAALASALLAVGSFGCSTDSTNGASNRDDAATDTTTSRRAQGLDAGNSRDPRAFAPIAANSAVTPQDSANGSMSGTALTGDVTQDTSAVQEMPLNTSPSAVNGLPPAGTARDTTSGTTSGALVTEERIEKKKTKKMKKGKKAAPAPAPEQPAEEPMEAPAN